MSKYFQYLIFLGIISFINAEYYEFDTLPLMNDATSSNADFTKVLWEIIGKIVPYIDLHDDFATIIKHLHLEGTLICDVCKSYYQDVADKLENNTALYDELMTLGYDLCMKTLKNDTVCVSTKSQYIDNFFRNYRLMRFDYQFQCGYQFGCFGFQQLKWQDYQKEVMADQPPIKKVTPTMKSTYKVLHLTDIHYEINYAIGSLAFNCGVSSCCWAQNGFTNDSNLQAKYWGQISNCDLPYVKNICFFILILLKRTVQQALAFAAENIKPDLILWTGDSNGHAHWFQAEANQLIPMKQVGQLIAELFPDVPIYPIYGNHEDYPIDEYDYTGNRTLIDTAVAEWEKFLDADALQQLKTNGYYSTYNQIFKLRIITLFTSACNVIDFYLISQPTDPLQQLEWLRTQLYQSEKNNENVIIQGHILIQGGDCSTEWARRYNALIDRFQNIIRGQFFGHTHYDSFGVFHSNITGKPISAQWITPSLTTYTYMTPALRVYEFDSETSAVVNHETYRLFNLSEWNKNTTTGPLIFQKAYDFVSEYGLQDYITLDQLDNLSKNFANINNTEYAKLTQNYIYYYLTQTYAKTPIDQLQNNSDLWVGYVCESQNGVYQEIYDCIGQYQEAEEDNDEYLGIGSFSQIWFTLNDSKLSTQNSLKMKKFLPE